MPLTRCPNCGFSLVRREGLLSDRQVSVLQLCARGLSAREIAAQLNVTTRTVKAHKAAIFRRLNVNRTVLAVAVAVRLHLIKPK